MKFLADECCDTGLVASLRSEGHDVFYIFEENPGASDEEILTTAYRQGRILLTEDKDFGELGHSQFKLLVFHTLWNGTEKNIIALFRSFTKTCNL